MKFRLLKIYLLAAVCFLMAAESVSAIQTDATAQNLRRLFAQSVGQNFEIVGDELVRRPRDTADRYWLVRVKPKRSGYYKLKYSFKFIKSYSDYPEEGEHTMVIGVGGKRCYRHNNPQNGISNVCLGDTVIIPIQVANATAHEFSFQAEYNKTDESLEEGRKRFTQWVSYGQVSPVFNQLSPHVKLLGIKSSAMAHRACCAETIDYFATFEAVKPGRFNLGLSSFEGDAMPGESTKMRPEDGTPIIIVNPGTPITALVPSEDTIHYADAKRFSSHAGNSFITNLMILQPGDVFTLRYSQSTINYGFGEKKPQIREIKPAIYRLPFLVDKNWSFNDWLVDYLPKGS